MSLSDEERMDIGFTLAVMEGREMACDCPYCKRAAATLRRLLASPAPTQGGGVEELRLLEDSRAEATRARAQFGPHPSADFSANRIAEESGELIAAATSTSKGRDLNRAPEMRKEAVQLIAMVLRMFREYPNGRPRDGGDDQ